MLDLNYISRINFSTTLLGIYAFIVFNKYFVYGLHPTDLMVLKAYI